MFDSKNYVPNTELVEILSDDFFNPEFYIKSIPKFSELISKDTQDIYEVISKGVKEILISPLKDYWNKNKEQFLSRIEQLDLSVDDLWFPLENKENISKYIDFNNKTEAMNNKINELLNRPELANQLQKYILENTSAIYQDYFIKWDLTSQDEDLTPILIQHFAKRFFWIFVEAVGNKNNESWNPTSFLERVNMNFSPFINEVQNGENKKSRIKLVKLMKYISDEVELLLNMRGKDPKLIKKLINSTALTALKGDQIIFNFICDDVRNMSILLLFDQFSEKPPKGLILRHKRYNRMLRRTNIQRISKDYTNKSLNENEYRLLAWPMIISKLKFEEIWKNKDQVNNSKIRELFDDWMKSWVPFFEIISDGKPPKEMLE
ncbi:MAG: hypothetical protein ACTSUV_05335 [Candidatus Ranarchaeia archaeon]